MSKTVQCPRCEDELTITSTNKSGSEGTAECRFCERSFEVEAAMEGWIAHELCKRCGGTEELEIQTMQGFDIEPCPDCRQEDH